LKAALQFLLYLCLFITGLAALVVVGVFAFIRWQYHLPSDQKARQQFAEHKADFVRFASMLGRDKRPRVINGNGDDDAFRKGGGATAEYHDLMSTIGAKAVYVRPDGSIEFELWGFGCAPCSDSFKGIRYSPVGAKPQADFQWTPKLEASLDTERLPKEKGVVPDGLYVVPLDTEWSIYRLEISD
jgi:hypothetical protein